MLLHRLKLALLLAFGVANIFPAYADEVVPQESDAKSAPPTAAEAKVRIWTAIFIDGETKQPLELIPVEVKCWKSGHREPQPMTFTTGSGGEVKIPLAGGTSTYVNAKDQGPWLYEGAMVGEMPGIYFPGDKPALADPSKAIIFTRWKGTEIQGTLLQPDGKPAGGVMLNAGAYISQTTWYKRLIGRPMEFNTWDHGDWPNWSTTVVTDENGSFHTVVPPSDARSWLRVGTIEGGFGVINIQQQQRNSINRAMVDYAPFEHEIRDDRRESTAKLDIGKLQLQAGVVLKGRVVDANGKPLAKVGLYTSGKHGPFAGRYTESADDGSFKFLPMNPGKIMLTVHAELRDEEGKQKSRDVQAVFVSREIIIPETDQPMELTVKAVPHVTLEFEWIDRRAKRDAVAYYGAFTVTGGVVTEGEAPVYWRGETEKTTRDGKEFLFVKVPVNLAEPVLHLSADSVVTASYEDDGKRSGPGQIPLGNITKPRRRIIYADEPKPENK